MPISLVITPKILVVPNISIIKLGHSKNYSYLCRCLLRLIETNHIRKDALLSNGRDELYTSINDGLFTK